MPTLARIHQQVLDGDILETIRYQPTITSSAGDFSSVTYIYREATATLMSGNIIRHSGGVAWSAASGGNLNAILSFNSFLSNFSVALTSVSAAPQFNLAYSNIAAGGTGHIIGSPNFQAITLNGYNPTNGSFFSVASTAFTSGTFNKEILFQGFHIVTGYS